MINQNIHTQSFQSNELILSKNRINESNLNLETYVSKVASIDKQQIKSYMGIMYFVLVSFLTITLLF